MLQTFIQQLGGLLDRRFLVAYWTPVFLAAGTAAASAAMLADPMAVWSWWSSRGAPEQGLMLAVALFFLTVLAYVLQALTGTVVRLYEGYDWPSWTTWLYEWKIAGQWGAREPWKYKARAPRTQEASTKEPLSYLKSYNNYLSFPKADSRIEDTRMLPTRLGNVLSAAEEYSKQVYGLDTVLWWPRLAPCLPEPLLKELDAAVTPMVALLNLSMLFVLLACGTGAALGAVLLAHRAQWLLVVPMVGDELLLAWLFYGAAVGQAASYGQLIRVAFDLHRQAILNQMHIPVPDNPREERQLWEALTEWVLFYIQPWERGWPPRGVNLFPNGFYYDTRKAPPQPAEPQRLGNTPGGTVGVIVRQRSAGAAEPWRPRLLRVPTSRAGWVERFFFRAGWLVWPWVWWLFLLAAFGLTLVVAFGLTFAPLRTPALIAKHDIPAWTRISDDDLDQKGSVVLLPPSGLTQISQARDRITRVPISRGSVVRETALLEQKAALAQIQLGWGILTVPLSSMPPPAPAETVLLLGVASGGKAQRVITDGAIALGSQGDQVVVAVADDEAKLAAPYLVGGNRLLVVRQLQGPIQGPK